MAVSHAWAVPCRVGRIGACSVAALCCHGHGSARHPRDAAAGTPRVLLNNGSSLCQPQARTRTPRAGVSQQGSGLRDAPPRAPPAGMGSCSSRQGMELCSGLLELWGRGSAWCQVLVALAALGVWGWHGSRSSIPPILHPAALRSRSRPAPGTAALPGELGFLGQLWAAGSRFWGLWEEDFQPCGSTWHCHPGDVAARSPHSPPAHPNGCWGSFGGALPNSPRKSSLLRESQGSCAGWHQPVQCQDPALPCGTPGSQGRGGAAGGTDAASTCLHPDPCEGGERGNFPDSFPHIEGGKKKKKREGVA